MWHLFQLDSQPRCIGGFLFHFLSLSTIFSISIGFGHTDNFSKLHKALIICGKPLASLLIKPPTNINMIRYFLCFISLITFFTIAESCATSSQLYRYDDKNKTYTGQLTDSIFTALTKYLTNISNSKQKDTIIIKYDYNNETCWDMLDQNNDDYIMGFVTRHNERVQKVLATRQNVSVFGFREPGTSVNKIKRWDNSILIDSSKLIFNLLFKERCTCGSSIIIMPDKRFVFLRSDSHSEVLNLTQMQIEELFSKK
jgi:hypothetical protein